MVGTIIPMVHGKRRRQRIPHLLVMHSIGGLVGGSSIGLLIGAVSSLLWRSANRPWLLVDSVVGLIAIGYSLAELELLRLPVPQSYWTVPRQWVLTKSEVAAVGLYGFCLGLGVLTRINTCLCAVIVWALLIGRFWECIFAMSIFGVCRTVPIWVMYFASTTDEADESLLYTYVVGHWQPAVRMISACALASIGGAFLFHGR